MNEYVRSLEYVRGVIHSEKLTGDYMYHSTLQFP